MFAKVSTHKVARSRSETTCFCLYEQHPIPVANRLKTDGLFLLHISLCVYSRKEVPCAALPLSNLLTQSLNPDEHRLPGCLSIKLARPIQTKDTHGHDSETQIHFLQ